MSLQVGKIYKISDRYKNLYVKVINDNNGLKGLTNDVVFMILHCQLSKDKTFYIIKGLIEDKIGSFHLKLDKIEEVC